MIALHFLESVLNAILDYSILLFEYIGVAVIVVTGIIGLYNYVRRDPLTRLKLAKGMAMGLEFKLGGEILRTVVVRDFSEILLVGSIILMRAALTFLIHWEIRNEESDQIAENQLAENQLAENQLAEAEAQHNTHIVE